MVEREDLFTQIVGKDSKNILELITIIMLCGINLFGLGVLTPPDGGPEPVLRIVINFAVLLATSCGLYHWDLSPAKQLALGLASGAIGVVIIRPKM